MKSNHSFPFLAVIILLDSLFAAPCNSQNIATRENRNTLSHSDINGVAKNVSINTYTTAISNGAPMKDAWQETISNTYNEQGELIESIQTSTQDNGCSSHETYNTHGDIIQQSYECTSDAQFPTIVSTYKYGDYGQILEERKAQCQTTRNQLVAKRIDNKTGTSELVEIYSNTLRYNTTFGSRYSVEVFVNNAEEPINKSVYNAQWQLIEYYDYAQQSHETYKYDDHGNQIRYQCQELTSGKTLYRQEDSYDSHDRLSKSTLYSYDVSFAYLGSSYDSDDNEIVEEEMIISDDATTTTKSFEYSDFDSHNNWQSCTITSISGEKTETILVERRITYYR